jgi:hypothetical protein
MVSKLVVQAARLPMQAGCLHHKTGYETTSKPSGSFKMNASTRLLAFVPSTRKERATHE